MDAELLARIQFGFTIAFHYIYPPLSIGLGMILVFMEGMFLKTRNPVYEEMTRFWVRIFSLVFAVGVATGIVMEFEFGTNWAAYSRYVGDIFGSALAAEGIFAFFLESGFLAILVFGWDKVSPRVHFVSTILVALGSMFSAVWIIVANSWQQTPAGYKLATEGPPRALITDFWAMVFNPSTVDRLTHTVVAAWATGAFFVMSVSAFYLLRRTHTAFAQASLRVAVPIALVSSLLQPLIGHSNIGMVARYQPAKLAAFEGHYDSSQPLALTLVGWTNQATHQTVSLKLPGLGSWLLFGDPSKPVPGLARFSPEDQPPANAVFQTYHLMIGTGMAMILLAALAALQLWRRRLQDSPLLLRLLVAAVVLPHVANQAGWFTAELGRQPWIVYGLLRTRDGLSEVVKSHQIVISLLLFALIYALLFTLFIYLLDMKIRQGPEPAEEPEGPFERGLHL